LTKAVDEFKSKDYDGQMAVLTQKVEELTAEVSETTEKMVAVETAKAELQKQFDEATQRAEKSEAELEEIRKGEVARERMVELSKVKKVEDEAATLAELRDMTEETFAVVLKYAGTVGATTDSEATPTDDEGDQAIAALDDAQVDNSADLNATQDAKESDADKWKSAAKALCGQKDEKEGGE